LAVGSEKGGETTVKESRKKREIGTRLDGRSVGPENHET